jgi:hypothetical protein
VKRVSLGPEPFHDDQSNYRIAREPEDAIADPVKLLDVADRTSRGTPLIRRHAF